MTFGIDFNHPAADPSGLGVAVEEADRRLQKSRVQHHVAVQQVEKLAPRGLKGELGTRAAGPFVQMGKLENVDGVSFRDFERAVRRAAVREQNLSLIGCGSIQRADQHLFDVLLLVERLDTNGQLHHHLHNAHRPDRKWPARANLIDR